MNHACIRMRLVIGAAAVMSFVAVAGWSRPTTVEPEDVPYGVASNYIVGHMLLREGKIAEALPYLHTAYRSQPNVIDIARDFEIALASQGYLNDAIEVANALVAAYPDSLAFLLPRANLYLKAGKTDRALDDLRFLRENDYITLQIVEAEAQVLLATRKFDECLAVYRDGLKALPDDATSLYLSMSNVLQQAGRSEKIPPLLTAAIAQLPAEPQLRIVLGRALAVLGRPEAALASARAADTFFAERRETDSLGEAEAKTGAPPITHKPNLPPDSFVVELADFYAQRNEVEQALAVLLPQAEAGELSLTPSLWLARLLLGTGRVEEGSALVDDILKRWPDSGRAWFLKARVNESMENWPDVVQNLARAADLEARDPEIRLAYVRAMLLSWATELGSVELAESDQKKKQKVFERQLDVAVTLIPDGDFEGHLVLAYGFKTLRDFDNAAWHFELAAESPDLRRTALLQRSICLDVLGKTDRARRDLETLNKEFPGDPEIANSLGYFLAEKGVDLEQAEDLVKSALIAEPGNGAFLDSLGWIYYRRGDTERALDHLIQAVNVMPDDPVILEHLGMVLRRQGKDTEALDVFERALAEGGDAVRLRELIKGLQEEARD